jgi:hypothetical protein
MANVFLMTKEGKPRGHILKRKTGMGTYSATQYGSSKWIVENRTIFGVFLYQQARCPLSA